MIFMCSLKICFSFEILDGCKSNIKLCLSGRIFYSEIYTHGAVFVSLPMKNILLFLNELHATDPVLISDS